MAKMRGFLPQPKASKGVPISAKGPQDLKPLTTQQFTGATIRVAQAFQSAVLLPSQFFSQIPLTGILAEDGAKRTLLAAFAHFNQNANLALNFFCRYKALIAIHTLPDLAQWLLADESISTEYVAFHKPLLDAAAAEPLQANGTFEPVSFVAAVKRLAGVDAAGEEHALGEAAMLAVSHAPVAHEERIAA